MNISVVIPLYNKSTAILRALDSVFNQTVQPDEVIVVNDGSTDGSEQIVAKLNHSLIRLINQNNAGVSAARNKGIAEATKEWIAFLDADDEWMPDYIETITSLSKRYPQCHVLATSYLLEDHLGFRKRIILNRLPFKNEDGLLSNYFDVASCSHPPLWSSAVVAKKSAIESISGFPVGINLGEDLLTWARLAVKYEIAYSIHAKSIFIHYENSILRTPQIPDIVSMELQKLFQNHRTHNLKKYIALWHKMRAYGFLILGQKKNALSEIYKSIRKNLFTKSWYLLPFIFLDKRQFKLASEKYREIMYSEKQKL